MAVLTVFAAAVRPHRSPPLNLAEGVAD